MYLSILRKLFMVYCWPSVFIYRIKLSLILHVLECLVFELQEFLHLKQRWFFGSHALTKNCFQQMQQTLQIFFVSIGICSLLLPVQFRFCIFYFCHLFIKMVFFFSFMHFLTEKTFSANATKLLGIPSHRLHLVFYKISLSLSIFGNFYKSRCFFFFCPFQHS